MDDVGDTPLHPLLSDVDTAPRFWQMGIMWSVLASGDQTGGAYTVMEQLMPHKAGPPPHRHERKAELFYVLDGEMALQLDDQVATGRAGQLVRIPAGTTHSFAVLTPTARVLNFYVPAALDLTLSMTATPAVDAGLPPAGAQEPPTAEQTRALLERLHELETQSPSSQDDLIAHLRAWG